MKAMVKALFHPDVDPAVLAEAESKMLTASPAMAGALMESLADYDLAAAARATAVPIRCINGDLFATQVEKSRGVHADYDAVVLQHMGHYPMLENPALFNATLADVLARLARPPAKRGDGAPAADAGKTR
jgi:pimeloyl-ACP methyl ester carboxylesterase